MFEPIIVGEVEKIDLLQLAKYRVTLSKQVPKPSVVLSVNGQIISTRKNIFGITGKAKVGKSYLMNLIITAVLEKGDNGTLASYLPQGKDKILWFDTEQSDYHVQLAMQRISKGTKRIDNLITYAFDTLSTEHRFPAIKELITQTKGVGLVIIDGIADLIFDVNNVYESTRLIDDIRKLASENDIAIGYVLHQNPTDSSKMRGHLGTTLTNKSETVIQIESCKNNDSIKLVSTTHTRNRKPEDWSFEIDDQGMPIIMAEKYEEPIKGRKPLKIHSDDEIYQILEKVYQNEQKGAGLGYTVIVRRVMEIEKIGENKSKELMKYAREMGYIYQDTDKKYFLK